MTSQFINCACNSYLQSSGKPPPFLVKAHNYEQWAMQCWGERVIWGFRFLFWHLFTSAPSSFTKKSIFKTDSLFWCRVPGVHIFCQRSRKIFPRNMNSINKLNVRKERHWKIFPLIFEDILTAYLDWWTERARRDKKIESNVEILTIIFLGTSISEVNLYTSNDTMSPSSVLYTTSFSVCVWQVKIKKKTLVD